MRIRMRWRWTMMPLGMGHRVWCQRLAVSTKKLGARWYTARYG